MEWYTIPLFIVGLLCLIKGGDWFVDGASGIAKRFKIPEILIGATVVSIGTTLPEVMVSATSAVEGVGGIAFGNAIGSIICNSALIAAIPIIVKPGKADRKSLIVPSAFFFGAAIFYSLIAYISGEFSRITGIVLLAIFAIYMVLNVLLVKRSSKKALGETEGLELKENAENWTGTETNEKSEITDTCTDVLPKKHFNKELVMELVFIVIGAALIAVGARLLVDNATVIATAIGMSEAIIGLTIVALGTSLPELVTAITALVKGHGALSLGNVIGANLFNLILVAGVSMTISPFAVPQTDVLANGMLASLAIDIPVSFGVMLILVVPTLIRKKLSRVQGIALLGVYIGYLVLRMVLV